MHLGICSWANSQMTDRKNVSLNRSEFLTFTPGKLRPSLDNLGNTCFLNCITQSLASIDMFYLWLQDTLSQQIQSESSDSEAGEIH